MEGLEGMNGLFKVMPRHLNQFKNKLKKRPCSVKAFSVCVPIEIQSAALYRFSAHCFGLAAQMTVTTALTDLAI